MVFQPLKYYYAKVFNVLIRNSIIEIIKLEFLLIIEGIRK